MTNEIDEKALVREGDWLETEGEIDWPNLPGIHFDYTDEPDASQNIASGDLSALIAFQTACNKNRKEETDIMLEYMPKMSEEELLTYAAEIAKYRHLSSFINKVVSESDTLGVFYTVTSDGIDLSDDIDSSDGFEYASWTISDEEGAGEVVNNGYGDFSVSVIGAKDPEGIVGLSSRLGENFEPLMASIECFDRSKYERVLAAQDDEDDSEKINSRPSFNDFCSQFTLGLAREGIDDGNDGSNFCLYDSSPRYTDDPDLPVDYEGRLLAYFGDNDIKSSITGETMMGWKFEDDVTDIERNRATAAVVAMLHRMDPDVKWPSQCLEMLDNRYEALLDKEYKRHQRGKVAVKASGIEG